MAGSIRRSFALRSRYSASCLRKKRFSTAIAFLSRKQLAEIDDQACNQLKKDARSEHDVHIIPQLPAKFAILFCGAQLRVAGMVRRHAFTTRAFRYYQFNGCSALFTSTHDLARDM